MEFEQKASTDNLSPIGDVDNQYISSLPARLHRLSKLPWESTWIQQLITERKSNNTIKSYLCAVRKFITIALPDEGNLDYASLKNITLQILTQRINPENGRLDIWLQSMQHLKGSTINARIAAVSHLILWVGYGIPEYISRPNKGKHIPRTLTASELKKANDMIQKHKEDSEPNTMNDVKY